MARDFTIRETDVYKLIVEEMNNNAFAEKIQFSIADWITTTDPVTGDVKGLLIQKLALDSKGKFDTVTTFNENTYAKETNSFVAMAVGALNGEFTALNTIKDVVYDTYLEFLVCIDNIYVQQAIMLAIEECRKRFIQYERTLDVSYMDLDNPTSTTRIEETLKVLMAAQSIDYGDITQINGKQYLTYTLPITIEITNFGEFSNQQKIYLGVDALTSGSPAATTMYLMEPDEWHWGTASGTESVMLLPEKATVVGDQYKEIKSIAKDKGFAFTMDVQMDFQNANNGALLKYLYKQSMLPDLDTHVYKIRVDMYLYSSSTKTFVKDTTLTMERDMLLTHNEPAGSVSKGQKLVHSLVFVPYYAPVVSS